MSGKKRPVLDDIQLHGQFKGFERAIDDIDDVYLVVGSSVLNALFAYTPTISDKDKEQYVFDQMKQLYQKLSATNDLCKEMDSFNLILMYEQKIMRGLEQVQEGTVAQKTPTLLEQVIDQTNILHKKNHMTVVRNSGDRLYHQVMERGSYQGNRNIMLKDHEDIIAAFR